MKYSIFEHSHLKTDKIILLFVFEFPHDIQFVTRKLRISAKTVTDLYYRFSKEVLLFFCDSRKDKLCGPGINEVNEVMRGKIKESKNKALGSLGKFKDKTNFFVPVIDHTEETLVSVI